MSWKISTKTPVLAEGDTGNTEMIFDVEWVGSVPRHLESVGLSFFISDITSDRFDGVEFRQEGRLPAKMQSKLIHPDETGALKTTVSVSFSGDKQVEADEIFGIELVSAHWYERDTQTNKVVKTGVENVREVHYGVIANDDPDLAAPDIDTVIGRIRKLAEDGKIAPDIPGALERQVAQATAEAQEPGENRAEDATPESGGGGPLKTLDDFAGMPGDTFDFAFGYGDPDGAADRDTSLFGYDRPVIDPEPDPTMPDFDLPLILPGLATASEAFDGFVF